MSSTTARQLVFVLLLFFIYFAKSEKCRPKSCLHPADPEKPACGSDGISYPSRCLLERARCHHPTLTLTRRRGACRERRSCVETSRHVPEGWFRPRCRPDGGYEPIQCHPGLGQCWCVTQRGIPLPYTTVRHKPGSKPRCGKKKSNWRRSARTCSRGDKLAFNGRLLNTFQTEWTREHGEQPNDTVVLEWKFKYLDSDNNNVLNKAELKNLLQLARKALKPKQCAKWKNFLNSCGVIGDRPLTKQEWNDCFNHVGLDEGQPSTSSEDPDEDNYEDPVFTSPPHGVLSAGLQPFGQTFETDTSDSRDEDPTDCLSDLKTALSEDNQLYVPECTPDGRYKKIQCYKSAGYCWCVHEDTGKNIPGTAVKNGTPKCEEFSTASRPMKGCPEEKKNIFLRDLLVFLHNHMAKIVNGTTTFNGLPWIDSKEEQAATWSFVVFDKNKNKVLDRNEWKAFKELISSVKGLRKCGKKLPRYCDINKDRQITMTEWLDCLNVVQNAATSSKPNPLSPRFGKKNPLSMLLED